MLSNSFIQQESSQNGMNNEIYLKNCNDTCQVCSMLSPNSKKTIQHNHFVSEFPKIDSNAQQKNNDMKSKFSESNDYYFYLEHRKKNHDNYVKFSKLFCIFLILKVYLNLI